MSSIASKRRAMAKKINRIKKDAVVLDKRVSRQSIGFLRDLQDEISRALVGATGFSTEFLPMLKSEITRAVSRFQRRIGDSMETNLTGAWDLGQSMVDDVLATAEIGYGMPLLSDSQLVVLKDFSADLVGGLSADMLNKVNNAVTLNVVGGRTISDTAKQIDGILGIAKKKGMTDRALKIARTEVGRAQSVANQARMEQAKELVPKMKKQWVTGVNPRDTHAAADGQIRNIDEPYDIGGYKAMEPLDPSLPAEEVVRCNCVSVPYIEEF